MPGPGPHMMYTMGTGLGLTSMSDGRFSSHHVLTYSINAFFGPDIGSFSEWLSSTLGFGHRFTSTVSDLIHHPFYYFLILGFPLSCLYSWLSHLALRKRIPDSLVGPLTRCQCFLLIAAGSLSHFFLDHLFEENGQSTMYLWILSTGWWKGRAPVNPDAVVVVGFLSICLIGGFIYINSVKSIKSARLQTKQSFQLVLCIASLYCLWCATQVYLVNPRRPAVGEEADLGVLIFMATYFFLPHYLCMKSMDPKDPNEGPQLPL